MYELDFRDAAAVKQVVSDHQPDAIAHIGAMASVSYSVTRPQLYIDVNITGSVNLLEAAQENNTNNFVFASTSSVYGQTDKVPFVETGFEYISQGFVKFLNFALNGAEFLYGDLAWNSDNFDEANHSLGFLFVF